jgi:stage V sporulation protein B
MKIFKDGGIILDVFNRIKLRDFSGNTGLAIKNSTFQFLTNAVSKVGTLLFTVIIARLLMPELFGLYSLAFSTILLFATISDFGIGSTIIRFISREAGKKNLKKARAYLGYLSKIKFVIISILIVVLIASAKYISENFYKKPIFLALIAGTLYILFYGLMLLLQPALQSFNKFKDIFFGEAIFQFFRIALVSSAVLLSIKYALSNEMVLFFIFLALGISYLLVCVFLWLFSIPKTGILKTEKSKVLPENKKYINKFLIALSASTLSGLLFSYIDRIMLGHFVAAEFIGFYTIALSFVSATSALTGFAGAALFPIFSRIKGQRLEDGFKKALKISIFFGIVSTLFVLALAMPIILIIYGNDYLPATGLLRLLSLSFFTLPLSGIYTIYFTSIGKPRTVAKYSIISTIINILFSYVLITSLLKYGDSAASFGAGISLLLSQFFFIICLEIVRRHNKVKKSTGFHNL